MSKVRLINQVEQNSVNMIDIKLKEGQTGYNIIEEYIRRYWKNNIIDDVIISLGISYDGNTYEMIKEVASKNFKDIEFLNDWWEGQKFIKLFGIKSINEIDIFGGIYTE